MPCRFHRIGLGCPAMPRSPRLDAAKVLAGLGPSYWLLIPPGVLSGKHMIRAPGLIQTVCF
jgi:hypothetical protein